MGNASTLGPVKLGSSHCGRAAVLAASTAESGAAACRQQEPTAGRYRLPLSHTCLHSASGKSQHHCTRSTKRMAREACGESVPSVRNPVAKRCCNVLGIALQAHFRQQFLPTVQAAQTGEQWNVAGQRQQRCRNPQSQGVQGNDASSMQPGISSEAASLQQLGAKMGTKLRPESAQKIQVSLVHPFLEGREVFLQHNYH